MAKRIDLFDSTYSHFTRQVLETIREETFGQDIGQNSWTTVDEYDRFLIKEIDAFCHGEGPFDQ